MLNNNKVRIKVKFDHKVTFRVYDELNGEITEDDVGNLYTEIEIPNDYNLYNYPEPNPNSWTPFPTSGIETLSWKRSKQAAC